MRRSPLAPVSKKRQQLNVKRRAFVRRMLDERQRCEAGARIVMLDTRHRCAFVPVDVHEIVTRARGGDILDESNVLAICRLCHDWIHDHPQAASSVGLLARNISR